MDFESGAAELGHVHEGKGAGHVPAADADDGNMARVNIVPGGQEIHCSGKVFRIDVGGGYIAGTASAFTGKPDSFPCFGKGVDIVPIIGIVLFR